MENKKYLIIVTFLLSSLLGNIPVYADQVIYNVGTPRSDVDVLRMARVSAANTGANILVGEEVTSSSALIGESFNKIIIPLEKEDDNTITGTVYAGVWDSTATPTSSNRLKDCGSKDVNTIANTLTFYTFTCLGSPYTLSSGKVVGVFYNTNTIALKEGLYTSSKASTFNSTSTRQSCFSSNETSFRACGADTGAANVWIDSPTVDLLMNLTLTDQAAAELQQCVDNPETVFCRLGGSSDNSASGTGALVGAGIVTLGCNVAFVNCSEDSNPATNGLGILIFIASIFVVVGMFYWGIGKDTFHLPLFIWVLIIIALSAFFTIIGIIDPVFLIISIIAIVALAAPKVLSSLKGSTFGGGSSE